MTDDAVRGVVRAPRQTREKRNTMSDEVLYETDGPIATLILNRPDKMNAFNVELFTALGRALDKAEQDPAIRVVILKGAGRAFSVGMDLDGGPSPAQLGVTGDRSRLQSHIEDFLRVWDFPKPVIAQVHGYCVAAATMLALASRYHAGVDRLQDPLSKHPDRRRLRLVVLDILRRPQAGEGDGFHRRKRDHRRGSRSLGFCQPCRSAG